MMLTPKDQRTAVEGLLTAAQLLRDQTTGCPSCVTSPGPGVCELCDVRLDEAARYATLANRLRSES